MSLDVIKAPDFIEVNIEKEYLDMKEEFESLTGKTLYPAQDETIMLKMFAERVSLAKSKFNEAAKLNLVRFSKAPYIDFIGEAAGCKRLKESSSSVSIELELYESFSNDLEIEKGLEILTKDEKFIFKTMTDLTIPAGEVKGVVRAECTSAGAESNNYAIDEINILVQPLTYIKSVSNIDVSAGGADEESDEDYAERIILAPESYSCAGSRLAYVYHTLSAHASIVDAKAEAPQLSASIEIVKTTVGENETEVEDVTTLSESENVISNDEIYADVDYVTNTVSLKVNSLQGEGESVVYKVKIPHAATVKVYPLTLEDELSEAVKTAVENKLSGEDVLPMTDYVVVEAAQSIDVSVPVSVVIKKDAEVEKTKTEIENVLQGYKDSVRSQLGIELLPSKITSLVDNVEGVYSVDLGGFEKQSAKVNEYFVIDFAIEYEVQV